MRRSVIVRLMLLMAAVLAAALLVGMLGDRVRGVGTGAARQLDGDFYGVRLLPPDVKLVKSRWAQVLTTREWLPGVRVLTVRARKQALRAEFKLPLPKGHPLLEVIQRGMTGNDARSLVEELLGRVTLGGQPMVFDRARVGMNQRTAVAVVRLSSRPVPLSRRQTALRISRPGDKWCCAQAARVVISADGLEIRGHSSGQWLGERTKDRLVFTVPASYSVVTCCAMNVYVRAVGRSPRRPQRRQAVPAATLPARWVGQSIGTREWLPGVRVLTVRAQDQTLRAEYQLPLPKDHPLLGVIQRGVSAEDTRSLVDELLGRVTVDGQEVVFKPPRASQAEGAAVGMVTLSSHPVELAQPNVSLGFGQPRDGRCCAQAARIDLRTDGVEIMGHFSGEWLARQTKDGAILKVPAVSCCPESQFTVRVPSLDNPFHRLWGFYLPVFGVILIWLAISIPLLVFQHWRSKDRLGGTAAIDRYAVAVPLLIGFYLGLLVILAVDHLLWYLDAPRRLVDVVRSGLGIAPRSQVGTLIEGGRQGITGVLLVTAAVVWPFTVGWWISAWDEESSRRRWWTATRPVLALLLLAPIVAVAWNWAAVKPRLATSDLLEATAIAAGLLAVMAFILWMLRRAIPHSHQHPDRRAAAWPSVLTAALICTLVLVDFVLLADLPIDGPASKAVRVGTVLLVGAILTASLLRVLHRGLSSSSFLVDWRKWRKGRSWWVRWLIAAGPVALVLLVIPIPQWSGSRDEWVSMWYLFRIADWLSYVVYGSLLLALVLHLRQSGADMATIRWPDCRYAALLYGIAFFFDPSTRFLYFPVLLIVGYPLLRFWLLRSDRDAAELGRVYELARRRPLREVALRARLQASRTKSEIKQLRKNSENQEADTTPNASRKQADALEASLRRRLSRRAGGWPIEQISFSLGPKQSPWENGKAAAIWALVFSIPWNVIYLRNLVTGPFSGWEFPFLSALPHLWATILQWVIYGFFLGYFYPLLRGSDGIRKGLFLALVIIMPQLVWTAFAAPSGYTSWTFEALWCLEVLANLLVVGFLTGDLRTLRSLTNMCYGRQELLELHNLGALTVWAGSVVAASGTALVGLFTSRLVGFVSQITGGTGTPPTGGS